MAERDETNCEFECRTCGNRDHVFLSRCNHCGDSEERELSRSHSERAEAAEARVRELEPLAEAYREIGEATIKRDDAFQEYDNKAYSWELHDQTVEPYKTSVRELNALLGRAAEHAKGVSRG